MNVKQILINAQDFQHALIHMAHMNVDVIKVTLVMDYQNVMMKTNVKLKLMNVLLKGHQFTILILKSPGVAVLL